MERSPKYPEIDHRTIKLLVGAIAIAMPYLVSKLAEPVDLGSISASYWEPEWPRTIFVGCLFAIGAFLAAYNGRTRNEMIASKVAALSAFVIAMFPCGCGGRDQIIPGLHYAGAAAMFVVLAFFCWKFFKRAVDKIREHPRAKWRCLVYALCGAAIVIAILALVVYKLDEAAWAQAWPTYVYWFETIGLVAFGISWLTASRVVPGLAGPEEQFSPLRADNPPD